jgi:TonB-linked SusC/RagA family outer membrane protein
MRFYYHFLKRRICQALPVFFFLLSMSVFAQNSDFTVRGTVRSDTSVLEGVVISVKSDPKKAVKTDEKGNFSIKAPANGTLVFSFVGYQPKEVEIKGESKISVILQAAAAKLDDVAVVAYGTQRKSSMVSSITTLDPKELKGPTSNLTTMLAGRVAGIIGFQRSGEPGKDNAQFFIRGITTFGSGKVNPLLLIDGMESTTDDVARLQPDDLAGFSILKDATAASLYGARGANGVILITTKVGKEGAARFNVRGENSLSSNTRNFKLADNITYMKLANEAVTTRNAYGTSTILPYSQDKIAATAAGADPYLYPNNDWLKLLVKDFTNNQRYNMNVSGGGKVSQYYVAGTYNIDNGVMKVDKMNNFNSNIKLKNYAIRTNITINVTPTTVAVIRMSGQFDDYNGPVGGGAGIFDAALHTNPVMFPVIYPSSFSPGLKHPLFGNARNGSATSLYNNPYAQSVSGYSEYNSSTMLAQLDLKQNFSFILPGLSGRLMAYTNRYSYFDVTRQYSPFYYALSYTPDTKEQRLNSLNDNGTEYLSYAPGNKNLHTISYVEVALNYNTLINSVHSVSGMLITTRRNYLEANSADLTTDLQKSLPYRNQGLSGRFTYGYDNRYLAEFNFGYNGSERFAASNRFGFFPSAGLGWNLHNEKFFTPLLGVISRFKLRGTYGMVGNDQIGDANDRFFYLSNVSMNNGATSATFGENYGYTRPGVQVLRYPNTEITWEKAYKTNIGFDATFFKGLDITVDVFKEHRKNILMDRSYIPQSMGLSAGIRANVGEAEGKGMEMQVDYNTTFSKQVWFRGRANFTYATSKLLVNEEPKYPEAWRSKVGYSLSQTWGLIAERLFVDDNEVANSPTQNFGPKIMGGDIKYRDVNGDKVINGDGDQVPIGYPTTPELQYGFGFSLGVQNFDISAFFQGSARSSFFIDMSSIQPFLKNGGEESALLDVIAKDHWSEDSRNPYAFWPRLDDKFNANNYWTSTWWMRNGAFLRLKTVELGYNFSQAQLNRLRLKGLRLYANAMNLFSISTFKMWDPEMGGNGLGYPVQRVVNAGINVSF